MATAGELLKELNRPKDSFSKLHQDFIDQCIHESSASYTDHPAVEQLGVTKDLIALLNNEYIVPLLIEKLLTEGPVFLHLCNLELYKILYKDNNDMLLDYTTIDGNPELRATYLDNGGDIGAFVIVTAQYWCMKQEEYKENCCPCENNILM